MLCVRPTAPGVQRGHPCLGASLARLKAQIAIPRFVQRIPKLVLGGPLKWEANGRFRGLKALPVTF